MKRFDRITIDAKQMDGVPCVRRVRIPVATVVGLVAQGRTVEQVLADYPDLVREDIAQAIEYAAEAVRERQPLRPAG